MGPAEVALANHSPGKATRNFTKFLARQIRRRDPPKSKPLADTLKQRSLTAPTCSIPNWKCSIARNRHHGKLLLSPVQLPAASTANRATAVYRQPDLRASTAIRRATKRLRERSLTGTADTAPSSRRTMPCSRPSSPLASRSRCMRRLHPNRGRILIAWQGLQRRHEQDLGFQQPRRKSPARRRMIDVEC